MKVSHPLTLIVTAGIVGFLGFIIGRMTVEKPAAASPYSAEAGQEYLPSEKNEARSRSKSAAGRNTRQPSHRSVQRTMSELIEELEGNPMAQMDFEGMFAIWEKVRTFSEEEIGEALEQLETVGNGCN